MNAPDTHLIGASVKRKEDYRFLTGNGQYTDDIVLPQQTYARVPALATRAREDQQHRHRRGQTVARRGRDLHRRGHGG